MGHRTDGTALDLAHAKPFRSTDAGLSWVYQPTELLPPPAAQSLPSEDSWSRVDGFLPAAVLTTSDLYNVGSRSGEGVVAVGAGGTVLLHEIPDPVSVGDPPARDLRAIALAPVAPNPTSRGATFRFALGAASPVRLRIYAVTGAEVATLADGPFTAGTHALRWDAPRVPSGVYFAALEAGGRRATRKFVVVK